MASLSNALQCSSDPLLTEAQAAHLLNLAPSTLQGWRHRRTGPPYQKIESLVRYRRSAIQQWLDARTVQPASEIAQETTTATGGGMTTAAAYRDAEAREAAAIAAGGGAWTAEAYRAAFPETGSSATGGAVSGVEGARS